MHVGITGWGVSVADVSSTMHLNRQVGKPQHSDVSWCQSCGQTLKVHSMPTRSRSEQKLCLGPTNPNNSLVIWRNLTFPQTKMKQPFMLCTQQPTQSTTQTSTARLQTLVCSKRRIKGLSVWNQERHQGSSGALFLTRFLSSNNDQQSRTNVQSIKEIQFTTLRDKVWKVGRTRLEGRVHAYYSFNRNAQDIRELHSRLPSLRYRWRAKVPWFLWPVLAHWRQILLT